jgi:hypothetical protein
METPLLVAVDVGSRFHECAIGDSSGRVLYGFRIDHDPQGFAGFCDRIEAHRSSPGQPVRVAMEGYNGWARPLDSQVLERGWALYNGKGCGQTAFEIAIVALSPWLIYQVWQDAEIGWTYLIAYLLLTAGALYSLVTGAEIFEVRVTTHSQLPVP